MKYAFTNGIILDGTKDMQPVRGKIIITDGDKIVDIADKGADVSDCKVVDLAGKYIMPGLINMHVHLPATGKPEKKPKDTKKTVKMITSNSLMRKIGINMCKGYAETELYSGVTTIRTVGGVADFDTKVRDLIEAGKTPGPRILAGNMAVSVPGGHMAGSLAYEAHNVEEGKYFTETIVKEHPNLIKLMITGGVLDAKAKGEPGELKMSPEIVKACCDVAHKNGLTVAAHVESPEGVRIALENGVDTIEHGAKPDEEIIKLFKDRKAAHICTISPALPFALFDREISGASEMAQYNGNIVFEGVIDCAKACLENGIPVGLGTDVGCPYITHYDMWRELNYFVKYCGVTNSFALHTATLINAQIAGIDNITGSIEKGKCADLIVTAGNPIEDIQALRNVDMVMSHGVLTENPVVKKMPEVETELDKFL
mgnify:FL=1